MDDLGRCGIRVGVHAVAGDDRELAAQIVAEAHAVGADALVAGAYRHNTLIEWALGGTTPAVSRRLAIVSRTLVEQRELSFCVSDNRSSAGRPV